MGIFDAILDLTLGEDAGMIYRLNKLAKDVSKAEHAQKTSSGIIGCNQRFKK
jgi:hypothetical protein